MLRRLRIENLVLIREAELALAPGLNVVTGETGAGKTILAHAIGLLLGARGDSGLLGPGAPEAYVEAELDLPAGVLDDDGLEELRELRPDGEPGLVVSRRVFADGRSRAYAWGRAVPREAAAAALERLVAMSGQYEQRRLARPAHQLDVLDAFGGEEQLRRRREAAAAWQELRASRRRHDEVARSAADRASRRVELEALVAAADGLEPDSEEALRAERDRLRNATRLAEAAAMAAEALAPELADADGAADLAARAGRALQPVAGLAPELADAAGAVADAAARLRDTASALRGFLDSLEAQPGRLEHVEERLGRIADAKRRFGAATVGELLERAGHAASELGELESGRDPLEEARAALEACERRHATAVAGLREARAAVAAPFAEAVRGELAALGLGDGELEVVLTGREPGPSGGDAVELRIRPNPGLPYAPVATTASGGELSRIALALRVVAHASAGEPTIVFDEIDAGIGGRTAHAVADALRRLAERAQVVAITHLPQIAGVADRHFRVEKIPGDPTHTRIQALDADERREELERMLGGAEFLEVLR
ncbi:MAG: AAA family ATPase [Thermoleophilia bacterium]|nr:AAA family ATPase [Thermoleophilia bacterium]